MAEAEHYLLYHVDTSDGKSHSQHFPPACMQLLPITIPIRFSKAQWGHCADEGPFSSRQGNEARREDRGRGRSHHHLEKGDFEYYRKPHSGSIAFV